MCCVGGGSVGGWGGCGGFRLTVCAVLCFPKVPPGAVPHRAASGDGLGLDGHHAQPVQLDLCGGHLRTHLCPPVLGGGGEGLLHLS